MKFSEYLKSINEKVEYFKIYEVVKRTYEKDELLWIKENDPKYVDGKIVLDIFAAVLFKEPDNLKDLYQFPDDDGLDQGMYVGFVIPLNVENGKYVPSIFISTWMEVYNLVRGESVEEIRNKLNSIKNDDWLYIHAKNEWDKMVDTGLRIRHKMITKDTLDYIESKQDDNSEQDNKEIKKPKGKIVAYDFGGAENIDEDMLEYAEENNGLLGVVDITDDDEEEGVLPIKADLTKKHKFKTVSRIHMGDFVSNITSKNKKKNVEVMSNLASTIHSSTKKGAIITFRDFKHIIKNVLNELPKGKYEVVSSDFEEVEEDKMYGELTLKKK